MFHNKACTEQKNLILEKTTTSVEISQEREQHGHMPTNSFGKPWQNYRTLTNSLLHGKEPSADDKRIPGTSEIGINCKPYKINMNRHGKYSFIKAGDDKLNEVETMKESKKEETGLKAAAKHQAIGKKRQNMT